MNRRRFFLASAGAALSAPLIGRAASNHPKIKIGQIGTKHAHAAGKIKAIRDQADTYELVGVVEPDDARRRELSNDKAYRGVTWLSEDELLNTSGLQAVAIETEVKDLISTAYRAIGAGKHIHLDKPAGDSLSRFRGLLKKAQATERIVQMGYMLRYNPAFQFMYQATQDGWLGEIMEIDCMMGKMASDGTRDDIGRFPGGGMFELGGHVIDSIVHMLGKPKSVSAYTRKTQSDQVADNQLAVLEFEQAITTVRINHRDPHGFPRRRFQIAGDKGAIEIQQMESGNVTLYLDRARGRFSEGSQQIHLSRQGERYDGEFEDLAKIIRGTKTLSWSYQHDLYTHEALLRASEMLV